MISRRIQADNAAELRDRRGAVFSHQVDAMMSIEVGEESIRDDGPDYWSDDRSDRQTGGQDLFRIQLAHLRDKHVLVVDDNPVKHEVLMRQLLPLGVRSVVGTGAKTALQAMRSASAVGDPFAMVVLGMWETEEGLFGRIRANEEFRDIPVVMLNSDDLIFR